MNLSSLTFRLLLAWTIFLANILVVTATGLSYLFERSINRGLISELTADLQLIARSVELDGSGIAKLSDAPTHPRFLLAYGGRYWQVAVDGKPVLMSPSLWNQTLAVPAYPARDEPPLVTHFTGPSDQYLLAVVQRIQSTDHKHEYQIATALDYAEILEAKRNFTKDVWFGVAGLAALLMIAAAAQVSVGLQPLRRVVDALAAVRNGTARRLEGDFPPEITPLIDETNDLLEARDDAIDAAMARAANLAHGLKTPLAVMAAQSRQLRRSGDRAFADEIDRQIEMMRRHVERELVLSRARGAKASTSQGNDAGNDIVEIVTALKKLPCDRMLDWQVAVTLPLMVGINRADFHDIVGNLLENAQKWATSRIVVSAESVGSIFRFSVDDDGAGVEQEQIARILRRGERADTSVPGTGLGLTIVNELVIIYGGDLCIEKSPLGGLRVALSMQT